MQTLLNQYREDAATFASLDRAMRNPARVAGTSFSLPNSALWRDWPANSQRWVRRGQLLMRRALRLRVALRSGPQHSTK